MLFFLNKNKPWLFINIVIFKTLRRVKEERERGKKRQEVELALALVAALLKAVPRRSVSYNENKSPTDEVATERISAQQQLPSKQFSFVIAKDF